MEYWRTLFTTVLLCATCSAYVAHMPAEDKARIERNFPRSKRAVEPGPNMRLPINFGSLPRLDVVTIENKPYTFIEKSEDGSAAMVTSGFIVDLMYIVGRRLNMQVNFYQSPDGKYGSLKENGEWTGLMGEVIKREQYIKSNTSASLVDAVGAYGADIAAAPLTITAERHKVVDFIKPFSHLGLTTLVQKPNVTDVNPFSFNVLEPLTAGTWGVIVAVAIVVWLFMFAMNQYNPYEYGERMKCNMATEQEGNLFSLSGSFMFMFTILQWQGFDRTPRSLASKVMGAFWMAFVTLILTVYIGSIINMLFWASMVHRVDSSKPTVSSLSELVQHKDGYTYGTLTGGSTYKYFTEIAKGEEFDIIREYFKDPANADKLVDKFDDGVAKVRSSKYGFICESMMAAYTINTRPCDLTVLDTFGSRSYGLAVAKNFAHTDALHNIILELTEEGDIEALEQKWFEIKGECWNITKTSEATKRKTEFEVNKPMKVDLNAMSSVLIMMAVGILLSVLVAVGEMLWFKYRGKYSSDNRLPTQQLTNNENM